MTDDWTAIVCSRGHGCRTIRVPRAAPSPEMLEWEARRHRNEVEWWGANLDEFAARLPRLRHICGDARAARLVRDVIAAVRRERGPDEAVIARDRLMDIWRGRRGRP